MSKQSSILRYLAIIKKLRSNREATFNEIADYLQIESEIRGYDLIISKRTFQRDVEDILTLFDIEIQFNFSKKVYYIEDNGQSDFNNRMLEVFDLLSIMNTASSLSGIVQFEKRKPQGTHHLYGLLNAIRNRNVILLSHQKFEDDPTTRNVEPYALKESQHRWYLVAKDQNDSKIKTFGLDRIISFEVTDKRFTKPDDFDLNTFFQYCFGTINLTETEPDEIILSFNYYQGQYVKTYPLHESQELIIDNDDEVRIKLKLFITGDLIMELLSYAASVKVLSPKKLADEICLHCKATIINY